MFKFSELGNHKLKLNLTYLIINRSDCEKPLLSIAEGVPQACQHLTSLNILGKVQGNYTSKC
jgi:hypothetical protein